MWLWFCSSASGILLYQELLYKIIQFHHYIIDMHLYSPVGVRDRIGSCHSWRIWVFICMRLNSPRLRFIAELARYRPPPAEHYKSGLLLTLGKHRVQKVMVHYGCIHLKSPCITSMEYWASNKTRIIYIYLKLYFTTEILLFLWGMGLFAADAV